MHFFRDNQDDILDLAARLTFSTGFAEDAEGILCAPDAESEPIAVAVLERFVGRDADFHFAMLGNHRFSRSVLSGYTTLAFHPRGAALERVWCSISVENIAAQTCAIRCGFQFEYRRRHALVDGSDAIVFSLWNAPARPQHQED